MRFRGDGRHRDQVCSRCGRSWSCVPDEDPVLCGACRGWHDPDDETRGAAAVASLVAAVAAQRAARGTRYLT